MRTVAESIELASAQAEVEVRAEDYVRLLGYPRGWELRKRSKLAEASTD